MAIGEKAMRYYPAFGVKSGRDALFRRWLMPKTGFPQVQSAASPLRLFLQIDQS